MMLQKQGIQLRAIMKSLTPFNGIFFGQPHPRNTSKRLGAGHLRSGTTIAESQIINSLNSGDDFTCPALNFSNRMSSRPIRAMQISMTEANFATSYKHKPGINVSTNIKLLKPAQPER
jgi:hypothetical protein